MHGTRRFLMYPLNYLDVVKHPVQQTVMVILAADYRIFDLPEMHRITLFQPWLSLGRSPGCTDHYEPISHWSHVYDYDCGDTGDGKYK